MRVDPVASPTEIAKLEEFVHLLDRWRKITNLISDDGFREVWKRHILDSIGLQRAFSGARRWLDLGAGAGFPGIVLGIMVAEMADAQIHCVESDGRKCAFLRMVVLSLRIPVKVHNTRAETLALSDTGLVDIVTARAFSSVKRILSLAEQQLLAGATLILPRGKTSEREVEDLDTNRYKVEVHANPAAGGGTFLQIQLRARGL